MFSEFLPTVCYGRVCVFGDCDSFDSFFFHC